MVIHFCLEEMTAAGGEGKRREERERGGKRSKKRRGEERWGGGGRGVGVGGIWHKNSERRMSNSEMCTPLRVRGILFPVL